jgi:hypothetical protein
MNNKDAEMIVKYSRPPKRKPAPKTKEDEVSDQPSTLKPAPAPTATALSAAVWAGATADRSNPKPPLQPDRSTSPILRRKMPRRSRELVHQPHGHRPLRQPSRLTP